MASLQSYIRVDIIDHIKVDNTCGERLPIHLNVSFPNIRCEEVSVDTVDSAGEDQLNVQGEIVKTPIDYIPHTLEELHEVASKCGSCHGAEIHPNSCCNTCDELKLAWESRGWSPLSILSQAAQCMKGRGCNIAGDVLVNKVSGNVHVALGRSSIKDGKHVHEFSVQDVFGGFNASHSIHTMRFGVNIPGVEQPLEGIKKTVLAGTNMFSYFIKIVPTEFVRLSGESLSTNQYSMTSTTRKVEMRNGQLTGLPGIFFVYEFNPFLIQKQERAMSLTQLITSFVAIIGGIFYVASVLDSALFAFNRATKKSC
eukprot:GHVR01032206.1.p1 GENE.GHVR01032206.1~~GHVR01032206.1.p1  ORF type:complete len:311 (+),score=55.11 GHVR01032206.1:141-1073(+)